MSIRLLRYSSPLPFPPISATSKPCLCSQSFNQSIQNANQNWKGLKLIRGEKLLKDLCTWGIGGPCNYFVEVFDQNQLISAVSYCNELSINFMIVGRGSNCLFDDLGFNGCVILNRIEFLERKEPGLYRVGSGFRFNSLGLQCSNEGFAGLEFAGGIPGTVGGATYMNAGANGQDTAAVIESVEIIKTDGKYQILNKHDLNFGYRSSPFQNMEDLAAIVAVTFRLGHSESAKMKQKDYLKRRMMSQPIKDRSAGSVFRNPSGFGVSAARLIDEAGLKGFRVGGAVVSSIHANFFINSGDSTCKDMLTLISVVKEKVDKKYGVQLKEEVLYIPSQFY